MDRQEVIRAVARAFENSSLPDKCSVSLDCAYEETLAYYNLFSFIHEIDEGLYVEFEDNKHGEGIVLHYWTTIGSRSSDVSMDKVYRELIEFNRDSDFFKAELDVDEVTIFLSYKVSVKDAESVEYQTSVALEAIYQYFYTNVISTELSGVVGLTRSSY